MHCGILAIKVIVFYFIFMKKYPWLFTKTLVGSGNEFTCIYFKFLLLYLFNVIILI